MTIAPAVADTRPSTGAPRWSSLDGVRGAAVAAVVGYHVWRLAVYGEGQSGAGVPMVFWPLGTARFAIDVFFVLSGFLVMRSWLAVRDSGRGWRAWWRFFGARARRVLPAYWLSLAVLLPLVAPTVMTDLRSVLLLVTVNQYVEPGLPASVNTPYWSLTTEWHFYLLVPLVAFLASRIGTARLLIGTLVLSVAWNTEQVLGLPASSLPGRIDQFVAGAFAGEMIAAAGRGHASRLVGALQARGVGVGILLAIVAIGTYHGSTLGVARGVWIDPLVHPVVGLLVAAGLVRLLTSGRRGILDNRALRGLGVISYSLYLWHYPILQRGLPAIEETSGVGAAGVLVVLLAAIGGVATLSWAIVERPFLRRHRQRAGSTPSRTGDFSVPMANSQG